MATNLAVQAAELRRKYYSKRNTFSYNDGLYLAIGIAERATSLITTDPPSADGRGIESDPAQPIPPVMMALKKRRPASRECVVNVLELCAVTLLGAIPGLRLLLLRRRRLIFDTGGTLFKASSASITASAIAAVKSLIARIVDIQQKFEDECAEHCRVVDIATAPLRYCISYYNDEGNATPGGLACYGGGKRHKHRIAAQSSLEPYVFESGDPNVSAAAD